MKIENFMDNPRTDLLDSPPQVTQPGRKAELWMAGIPAAATGLNFFLQQLTQCVLFVVVCKYVSDMSVTITTAQDPQMPVVKTDAMKQLGMDIRSEILYASLNIEHVANMIRNLNLNRTIGKDTPEPLYVTFKENIDYLISRKLMGTRSEERFRAFAQIRNKFIHEIRCKTYADLELFEPRPIPLIHRVAEDFLNHTPLKWVCTETDKLKLGIKLIMISVIDDCEGMVNEQVEKRSL